MSEDNTAGSKGRLTSVRKFEFAGKNYVILADDEFERLRRRADGPLPQPVPFTSESVRKDLRARRRLAGLTLAEVARRAGIALETLSRIETGRTSPTVGTLSSILRALDDGAPA